MWKVAALALALVLTLAMVGCQQGGEETTDLKPTEEPIKIGAVVSLTGPYAGLGGPEKNVIDMEVAKINAEGGINGRPIEVLIEDDGTDEKKAQAATAKLIDKEKVVALIGATGTGQTMAMRGDVDKAGIPQVSMAGGTVITQQFDKLVFQTPWSNTIVVPYTLKYLQGKGYKKVALIADNGGFGKDGIAVLKANLAKYGMTAVAEESFKPEDTDMTAQMTKIKNAKPDVIIMWTAGANSAVVLKNAEQLKIDIPIVGSHGNARMELVKGAGAAAEGFRFPAGKILLPDEYGTDSEEYKVAKSFVDEYTKKYGEAPSTFAGHAYDALYIIVDALKKLPADFTSAQLRDEIEKTKDFIGIGGTFNYSPTDHNGLKESDLVMYEVKGGKWVIAK